MHHLLHTADFGLATPTTKTNSARLGTAKVGNIDKHKLFLPPYPVLSLRY